LTLNIAGVLKLPAVFVIENNQFAYSTPVALQSASVDFATKAAAYGFPGVKVDGTDVLAVYDAVAEAVARARKGEGPSLVEAVTMRMHGHAEHDPADYVPKELFEYWRTKDPVELFEKALIEGGVIDEAYAKEIRDQARQHAIAARRKALADPMPDGSTVEEGVYAD